LPSAGADFDKRSVVVLGLVCPKDSLAIGTTWRFSTTLHGRRPVVSEADAYAIALFQELAKSQTLRTSGKAGNIAVVVG
jgi:hypothetical protein